MRKLWLVSLLLSLLVASSVRAAELTRAERKERFQALEEKYRQFLDDVDPIILPLERDSFLQLETAFQRDRFIEDFWKRRDPKRRSSDNPYRRDYYARLAEAKEKYRQRSSDRYRIFMAHGQPAEIVANRCANLVVPNEVWRYDHETLIFYSTAGVGEYKLWIPTGSESLADLLTSAGLRAGPQVVFVAADGGRRPLAVNDCSQGEKLLAAIDESLGRRTDLTAAFNPPTVDRENVKSFLESSIVRDPRAKKLDVESTLDFHASDRGMVEVELGFVLPAKDLSIIESGAVKTWAIDVDGEIVKDGLLFETFRYQFNPPVAPQQKIGVTIDRYLRPGEFTLRMRVSDRQRHAEAMLERALVVPELAPAARQKADAGGDESSIRIVPPGEGAITGFRRIEAITADAQIAAVEFYLDGTKVATKRGAPYAMELDFGSVPASHHVKVVALDTSGASIDGDDLAINAGEDRLRVRIEQPRFGRKVTGRTRVVVSASAPAAKTLGRVDLYLNDVKIATMSDPPFVQWIDVPRSAAIAFLRAVAVLSDESESAEDAVFLNAPAEMQEVTVHLVELPVTVLVGGKPQSGLAHERFHLEGDGKPIDIAKLEEVKNARLSLGFAIDTSASMQPKLADARRTASAFFRQVMKPGDRAFVSEFSDRPRSILTWTADVESLDSALASLRTSQSTALWDAIIDSLYRFAGVEGQKALVVITDGRDTASRYGFDQALEYAKRASVPVYTITLGLGVSDVDVRYRLSKLATETGGAFYALDDLAKLDAIYAETSSELRSQYLVGFYPPADVKPGSAWREITLRVGGAEVKAPRGYYP